MKSFFTYFASLSAGQQRFLVVLAVMVVLPFTALIGLQVYNAVNLAILGSGISARSDAWKAEAKALDIRVDPESLKSVSSRFAYKLLSSHDELVAERRAVVTVQVPLDDMKIKKGKPAEIEGLVDAASEQIQSLGSEECAMMIGRLAAECTVMSATGRALGTTAYEYQFQLAFSELHPFGKTDAANQYEFVVSRSSPGKVATRPRIYFEKSADQRKQVYADVADTCAAIRKKTGNCSVTALSIASRLDRGTPMARISASAAYASLVKASELAASTH